MASLTAVVIGAGALGASTAYHLARRGADVTLVDQYAPGSQTSPRAAGLTNTKAASTEIMARLTDEATETLAHFERGHRHRAGVPPLRAASKRRTPRRARPGCWPIWRWPGRLGIEVDLISPADAHRLAPWFEPGKPRAIGYVPSDAYLEPSKLPLAYVQLAQEAGVASCRSRRVTALLQEGGRLSGVSTPRGDLEADVVVDAAGGWARAVAAQAGIRLPLVPVRHQLFITEPISSVQPMQPVVRFLEASVYVRPGARRADGRRLRGHAAGWSIRPSAARGSRSPTWSSTRGAARAGGRGGGARAGASRMRRWRSIGLACRR